MSVCHVRAVVVKKGRLYRQPGVEYRPARLLQHDCDELQCSMDGSNLTKGKRSCPQSLNNLDPAQSQLRSNPTPPLPYLGRKKDTEDEERHQQPLL